MRLFYNKSAGLSLMSVVTGIAVMGLVSVVAIRSVKTHVSAGKTLKSRGTLVDLRSYLRGSIDCSRSLYPSGVASVCDNGSGGSNVNAALTIYSKADAVLIGASGTTFAGDYKVYAKCGSEPYDILLDVEKTTPGESFARKPLFNNIPISCPVEDDGILTCTEAAYQSGPTPSHYCMFASRYGYYGNLGGLSGADAKCRDMAVASGLDYPGVTWKAVLSDSSSHAKDRIDISKKIYSTHMAGGTTFSYYKIADENQLWVSTSAPLVYNEYGFYDTYKEPETYHGNHTWTATNSSGNHTGINCYNWTSSTIGHGHVGDASVQGSDDDKWQDGGVMTQPCNHRNQIYCISQ